MSSSLRLCTTLGLLVGCSPWQRDADFFRSRSHSLWDAEVVSAGDAVYVRLPRAKALVRVQPDGTIATVDLDGAAPGRMVPTPDGEALLVSTSWPFCDDPDPTIEYLADCPEEARVERTELALVKGTSQVDAFDVPEHLNTLSFSSDGRTAVAHLDYSRGMDIEVDGLIDLGEVMFIPLEGGEARSVSVGFSPEKVLFSASSGGPDDKAVIFSRSEVLVVDLETLQPLVSYPLVLDSDQVVDPRDAVLTADGRTALVAVERASDLYELDLETESIDLEELESAPTAMANAILPGVDDGADAAVTLIAYADLPRVDVLDQDTLELRAPLTLEEPVTDVLVTPTRAVLFNRWSEDFKDVYEVDLATSELTEYRVANPLDSLELAPGEAYAVGVLRPELDAGTDLDQYQDQHWGLAVIDLERQQETSLVLESEPLRVALLERDGEAYALVLLDDRDELLQVKLSEPTFFTQVEVAAPPLALGDLQDGRFYITHDASLGLISFLDPTTGDLTTVGGFATPGLFPDATLPRQPGTTR